MTQATNLLPWEFRKRVLVRRRVIQWMVVTAISACTASLISWRECQSGARATARLAELQQSAQPLRDQVRSNHDMARRLRLTVERQRLLSSLRDSEPPLQILGLISRGTRGRDGAIQVRSLSLSSLAADGATLPLQDANAAHDGHAASALPAPRLRISLDGIASDDVALSQFLNDLRDAGFFQQVELRGSSKYQVANGTARQYVMECVY